MLFNGVMDLWKRYMSRQNSESGSKGNRLTSTNYSAARAIQLSQQRKMLENYIRGLFK